MGRRAYTIIGVATLALIVTLVASTISAGSFFSGATAPTTRSGRIVPEPRDGPKGHVGTDSPVFPTWFVVIITTLLSLYALSLVALILLSRRRLREDVEVEEGAPDSPLDESWQAMMSVDLADAAEEQLFVLAQGTPRNAIVACWMSLQASTQRAGLPEEAAETSVEFAMRAMRGLDLDSDAITTLSALYREARFSEHEMREGQREQAMQAVAVVAAELGARRQTVFGVASR